MKTIIGFLCLLCIVSRIQGATYYFSSSTGNDSRTLIEAQNAATPFKSLIKLNSLLKTLKAGDVVLFKCGDIWNGSINIEYLSNIRLGSYGTGARPVISGAAAVGEWVTVGTNLYESAGPVSSLPTISILTINSRPTAMGRYPNESDAGGGYLSIDSHIGDSVIIDNENPSSKFNWKGATAVVRLNPFFLDTSAVKSHSSTRIDLYSKDISYELLDQFGYFIQNHPQTLDRHGEWYYNNTTKRLRIYLQNSPASNVIAIPAVNNVLSINGSSNISIENIKFEYANDNLMRVNSSSYVTLRSCVMHFAGNNGVRSRSAQSSNLVIENSFIEHCGNYGIDARDMGVNSIIGNEIRNIGIYPGMGGFANGVASQHRYAISSTAANCTIKYNTIDSIGYSGIRFYGNGTVVSNNSVSNFCLVLHDGGGIYTYNGHKPAGELLSNRKVTHNIVYKGGANTFGTKSTIPTAYGIYLDDNSSGVEIAYNTVFDCARDGLYIHNSHKLSIHHNLFFNNSDNQVVLGKDRIHPQEIREVNFKHNVLVAKTLTQRTMFVYNTLTTSNTHINSFGTIDSNYYSRPADDNLTIRARNLGQETISYSLKSWQATYAHDKNTRATPKVSLYGTKPDDYIKFIYNADEASKTFSLSGAFVDIKENRFNAGISVDSYGSILLLKIIDTVNSAPTVSITKPTDSSVYKAGSTVNVEVVASDKEGSIKRVDLFQDAVLIASDTLAPYNFALSNLKQGTYQLEARAWDMAGMSAMSAPVHLLITEVTEETEEKIAPSIEITSPLMDSKFAIPAEIQVSTAADDADGVVKKVDFYVNGILLETDTTAPFGCILKSTTPGQYTMKAIAQDNDGLEAASQDVIVTLSSVRLEIISPKNNEVYYQARSISIDIDAWLAPGQIKQVEFFINNQPVSTDLTAPYQYTWTNISAGTHIISVKLIDSNGSMAASAEALIRTYLTDGKPVVTITSPYTGTHIEQRAAFTIQASANDEDGKIASVEFFADSTLLGKITSPPYQLEVKNLNAGAYKLRAKATDNMGQFAFSELVDLFVDATQRQNLKDLTAYPNPTRNMVYVQSENFEDGVPLTIQLLSNTGFVVKTMESTPLDHTVSIDIASVERGTYFLQILTLSSVYMKKILKM